MFAGAAALQPQLLRRALELCHGRYADAEDLVGEALLALVHRPPAATTPVKLHHWLRTVMRNLEVRRWRDRRRGELEVVSLDVLEGWAG